MVQISPSSPSGPAFAPVAPPSAALTRRFSATLSQLSGPARPTPDSQSIRLRQPLADRGKDLPPATTDAPRPRAAEQHTPAEGQQADTPQTDGRATVDDRPKPTPPGNPRAVSLTLVPADVTALKDLLPPVPLNTAKEPDPADDASTGASIASPALLALPIIVSLPQALPVPVPVPVPASSAATAPGTTADSDATATPVTAATAQATTGTGTGTGTATATASADTGHGANAATAPTTPVQAATVDGLLPTVSTGPLTAESAAGATTILIETPAATLTQGNRAITATAPTPDPVAGAIAPGAAPLIATAPPPAVLLGIAQPAARAFASAIAAADNAQPAQRKLRELREPLSAIGAGDGVARTTAAAAEIAAKPIDLRQQALAVGLADRIEALRDAADATNTRIRLVPEGLGRIDIALRRDGETLHVHFAADVAATRVALTDAQPKLAEIAAERGLSLGQTSVGDGSGRGAARQASGAPAAPVPVRPSRASSAEETVSTQRIA